MPFSDRIRTVTCACIAWLSLPACAAAASADAEVFFNQPQVRVARISPSGEYLALVSRALTDRYSLLVMPTATPTKVAIVARSDVADIVDVRWVNDKRLVFVTSDLQGDHEISGYLGGLYAVDRDGSAETPLITGDWNYRQDSTGSAMHKLLLPAKFTMLATGRNGSDDIIVGDREFDRIDGHVRQLTPYRLDTKSRDLAPLVDAGLPNHANGWLFDEDGAPRTFSAIDKDRRIVYYRDAAAASWKEIGNFDAVADEGFFPQFMGFDNILYVAQDDAEGFRTLYRYDAARGRVDDQPVMHIKGFDYSGGPEIDVPTRKVLGFHYEADAKGTVWVDARFREFQARIDKALPATVNTISCGNCVSSRMLLVTAESDREPARYVLFDTVTGQLVQVGEQHPGIKASQMGERNFFRFTARDGLSIPVYVTLPPGKHAAPPPAVIYVHGGPWMRGASWEWTPETQFLASRGYAVIEPQFRSSLGFGFKLFQAGWRQWGMAMQDDLADAAQWAVAKGFADPKRIGIAGASYGGYATLMGLIRNPEIFRCGVEWLGVTDVGLMYSVAESDATEYLLAYGLPRLVGDREKDAAQLRATSPLFNAARLTQPLLMAYGDRDRRVPIVHGTEFRDAVRAVNKHVEWIDYPLEGHGWHIEADNIDFWKRVEKFLQENLAGAP
jgi:dipeptidyl aminopeptidase/acylaminoacyl peptidase